MIVLVNSGMLDASYTAEEFGYVLHQLIHNNDRIKMLGFAKQTLNA